MTHKISFELSSPILLDYYGVGFDALILKAFHGNQYPTAQKEVDISLLDTLFNRHEDGWLKVSFLLHGEGATGNGFWCKRLGKRLYDYYASSKKIDTTRGRFKSYKVGFDTLSVPRVWFYFDAKEGRLNAIDNLCQGIVGIGKKVAQGYGFVSGFHIERAEDSVWREVLRPIPKDQFSGTPRRLEYRTATPPYWMNENAQICIVDGIF